jgi:hypothetical protein
MGAVWQWFLRSLSPQQVCWLCLLVTMGAGFYGITTFARESEVSQIRIELLQPPVRGDQVRGIGRFLCRPDSAAVGQVPGVDRIATRFADVW